MCKFLESQSNKSNNLSRLYDFSEKICLEIGSGTGLIAMIAQVLFKCKHIIATDKDCAIPLLKHNVKENNNKKLINANDITICELTWGDAKQLTQICTVIDENYKKFNENIEWILIGDCIAWHELYNALIGTLVTIVNQIEKQNKHLPNILMSYEIRKPKKEKLFFQKLTKLGWKHKQIDLKQTCIDPMYICKELVILLITPCVFQKDTGAKDVIEDKDTNTESKVEE